MSTDWMVFLRAINVGGNRITSPDLISLIESVTGSGVRSYLASGNLLVPRNGRTATDIASLIDDACAARGLKKVVALVRDPADIARLIDLDPFNDVDPLTNRLAVTFLREPVSPDVEMAARVDQRITVVHRDPTVMCSVIPKAVEGGVGVGAPIESTWKVLTTTRWWNVVVDFHARAIK